MSFARFGGLNPSMHEKSDFHAGFRLVDMITAEKNRQAIAAKEIRREIQTHTGWLKKRLARVDDDLSRSIKSSPIWKAKDDILQSIPGIGLTTSMTMLADGRFPLLTLMHIPKAHGCQH